MTKLLISGAGRDRPGIVAAVTEVLFSLGCNLEDTSMTRLEDHFAMLLIAFAPEGVTGDDVRARLQAVAARFDLHLAVTPIETERESVAPRGRPFTISVTGPDQTGILFHVTRALAGLGVNIGTLTSKRLSRPEGAPLYLVAIEAEVPEAVSDEELRAALAAVGTEQGLDVHAEPIEEYRL